MIRPSFNYLKGQMDGYQADTVFLGVAGLQKADAETERTFFRETLEKLKPKLVIPIHWDDFFSPLTKPIKGLPLIAGKTEVAFYKMANYCEEHKINFLIQAPDTAIEI